jgi:hypothetical protein
MLTEFFDPMMLVGIIVALGSVFVCWFTVVFRDILSRVKSCKNCNKWINENSSKVVINGTTYCSNDCMYLYNRLDERV